MTAFDTILPVGKLHGDFLARLIARHKIDDPAVLVGPGIGRDAAAIEIGDMALVVKTDPITFATDAAAHYLVNVNANDLACLGARPRWMLVTALLPEERTTLTTVESLFADLQRACEEQGIALIGGHTEITSGIERIILVGQLLGLAPKNRLVIPGQAKPGDRLLLTKALAIEGTALLARERRDELTRALGPELVARAANLLVEPGISVVGDAEAVLTCGGVSALHDPTEGGCLTGIWELATASGCGVLANADLIPILPETLAIARHFGLDPLGMLASGSLLAAVTPSAMSDVEHALQQRGIVYSWIGKLTSPERGLTLIRGGRPGVLSPFVSDEVARALGGQD
jgi:hydrogenase expression/formation protein HypE